MHVNLVPWCPKWISHSSLSHCVSHHFVAAIFAEYLRGFQAALPPDDYKYKKTLPSGDYLFPDFTIQCSGKVTVVHFVGYFTPGVLYNDIISMQLAFYTQSGSQYNHVLEIGNYLLLSLEPLSQLYPRLKADDHGVLCLKPTRGNLIIHSEGIYHCLFLLDLSLV